MRIRARTFCLGFALALAAPAFAEEARKPGEIAAPSGRWQVPGEIQQPKGSWQVPGKIQTPGQIQKPGEIQQVVEKCRTRLVVGADALFEFDRAELTAAAEASLAALEPAIRENRARHVSVEGHTDAKGATDYNQALSERRAGTVRDWLVRRGAVPAGTPMVGYGESRPVAPNVKPDGSDDPEGRAKNRRVEVVLDTCDG